MALKKLNISTFFTHITLFTKLGKKGWKLVSMKGTQGNVKLIVDHGLEFKWGGLKLIYESKSKIQREN